MFKVYKKIGKGSFASVYLAQRIEDGKELAVKAFAKS
jgi:calcium-dependent protein kinase